MGKKQAQVRWNALRQHDNGLLKSCFSTAEHDVDVISSEEKVDADWRIQNERLHPSEFGI